KIKKHRSCGANSRPRADEKTKWHKGEAPASPLCFRDGLNSSLFHRKRTSRFFIGADAPGQSGTLVSSGLGSAGYSSSVANVSADPSYRRAGDAAHIQCSVDGTEDTVDPAHEKSALFLLGVLYGKGAVSFTGFAKFTLQKRFSSN